MFKLLIRACALLALSSSIIVTGEEELLFQTISYAVESTVLLNDVQRRDREVGYKIKAQLRVSPSGKGTTATATGGSLLRFDLKEPKLYLKGKHINAEFLPQDSILDSYKDTTFYALWVNGTIATSYLDPNHLPDIENFKRSLISLFQFQTSDGEYNETDVSGVCSVLYEAQSQNILRKTKLSCSGDGKGVWVRRLTRYHLLEEGEIRWPQHIHAEEILALGHDQLGLKARTWLILRMTGSSAAPKASEPSDSLRPTGLELMATQRKHFPDYESVEAAVEENALALGDEPTALETLMLLGPLRAADKQQLTALLTNELLAQLLPGLSRALGLAGTEPALLAADQVLHLRAEDPVLPHALLYLEGFALSAEPHSDAIVALLRLAERARHPHVAEAALLAVAAAAHSVVDPVLADSVRDTIVRGLSRCADDDCRRVRLLALGNMRRIDTAELLLERAERRDGGPSRLAALQALAMAPPAALDLDRKHRLTHLALHQALPLEVRAAALELVVARSADRPARLVVIARELYTRGPHELRRLFWQRMRSLADKHIAVRQFLNVKDSELRGWDAQAHAGTSCAFERSLGWTAAGWSVTLGSLQLSERGLLKRGQVRLALQTPDNTTVDLLGVELWTRGIESLTGAQTTGVAPPDDEETVAGGLALAVAGTRMRALSLFDGQAELLGHVWAGTGSTATPALRAVWSVRGFDDTVPLLGGIALRHRWRAALALALDAQAQVSLWWRTARSQLELRTRAAALAEASLLAEWGAVRAQASLAAEPRLHVASDVDFYEGVSVCARLFTDRHEMMRNVSLWSAFGEKRVMRWRLTKIAAEGRTLSLGVPNDHVCRELRAKDTDAVGD